MWFEAERWLRRKSLGKPSWQAEHVEWIGRLEDWFTARGWSVTFTWLAAGPTTYTTERMVQVPLRSSFLVQVMALLHEAGHVLVGNREDGRYGGGYFAKGAKKRILKHKVDILDEELEAWHRGAELAKRLGIDIPQRSWDTYKSRCIKTWAALVVGPAKTHWSEPLRVPTSPNDGSSRARR